MVEQCVHLLSRPGVVAGPQCGDAPGAGHAEHPTDESAKAGHRSRAG
ncbi:hypothetical protein ACFWMU_24390 [Streptomyces sp. NPDC058357]